MTFGVTPLGFTPKPLSEILADIEAANRETFGAQVIQTPASPLGQLNGLAADLAAELWELGQDVYASFDIDQAEGLRLDALAKHRLIGRQTGEDDTSLRRAITNAGRGRIDLEDIERAAAAVSGVTYAQAWANESATTDANGMPAGSVAIAVLGGDDDAIAEAVRPYIVPGVIQYGNTSVSLTLDGRCRTVILLRPTVVDVAVTITVTRTALEGCPPPSTTVIGSALAAALNASRENGADITLHMIRSTMAGLYGAQVEVVSSSAPHVISFDQIANVTSVTASDA